MTTATIATSPVKQTQTAVDKLFGTFIALFSREFKREKHSWSDGPQIGL
jgi:hypothetical protein